MRNERESRTDPLCLRPELGRFLQPDPKEFAAGDYNLYRYCHNDPVNRSDPDGLEFYDHDPEPVPALTGKFGNTEARVSVGVNSRQEADGTYSLYVSHYDVFVTSKEIAQTANGISRTQSAIRASITHENRHSAHMRGIHNANQHRVLQTGLKSQPSFNTKLKESEKLSRAFDKAAQQDQRDCKKPTLEWKSIILQER